MHRADQLTHGQERPRVLCGYPNPEASFDAAQERQHVHRFEAEVAAESCLVADAIGREARDLGDQSVYVRTKLRRHHAQRIL